MQYLMHEDFPPAAKESFYDQRLKSYFVLSNAPVLTKQGAVRHSSRWQQQIVTGNYTDMYLFSESIVTKNKILLELFN